MPLQVELAPRAYRDLVLLEKHAARTILKELAVLEQLPWPGPPKVKKITAGKGLHRLRSGNYRAVFERQVDKVVVLRIMDRKNFEKILDRL